MQLLGKILNREAVPEGPCERDVGNDVVNSCPQAEELMQNLKKLLDLRICFFGVRDCGFRIWGLRFKLKV